jgi:hypothetical protein
VLVVAIPGKAPVKVCSRASESYAVNMEWTRGVDLSVILPTGAAVTELSQVTAKANIPFEGACGFLWGDSPVLHFLVVDNAPARDVLEDAGFDVMAEREVLVVSNGSRDLLTNVTDRLTSAGVRLDIMYMTADGRLVIGVDDFHKAQTALG